MLAEATFEAKLGPDIKNFFELTDEEDAAHGVALPSRGAHHLVDRCAFGSPQHLNHLLLQADSCRQKSCCFREHIGAGWRNTGAARWG
jgi:hypothetical protein